MTNLFKAGAWGLRAVCCFAILVAVSQAMRADLSPREYRRLQRDAPEELRIEAVAVHERPIRERDREFEVVVDAKVLRIHRTGARIHEGDVIKITYVHHRYDRPLPGAGEAPVLESGHLYRAYLTKLPRERNFKPAAGIYSFERPDEPRP